MARYKVSGEFTVTSANPVGLIEVAELTDTQTGTVYKWGARRFRLTTPVDGYRTKTFHGEMAQSFVEAYAADVLRKHYEIERKARGL